MKALPIRQLFRETIGDLSAHQPRLKAEPAHWTNDDQHTREGLSDPMLALFARAEIDATRLW